MKRLVLVYMASILLVGSATSHGFAGSIVIGSTGGGNVFPLGTNNYKGEYQQLYASSAFPGQVTLTEVAFSSRSTGTRKENITVSLSTTTASVSSPSSNYAANKGSDFTTVFSGPLTFTSLANNT
jgi:hypothetical protein